MYKFKKVSGFVSLSLVLGLVLLIAGGFLSNVKSVSAQSASTITVTSPNGGEAFVQGQTVPITWTSTNMGALNVSISLIDVNRSLIHIVSNVPNTGSYNWSIPTNFASGSYQAEVDSNDIGPSTWDYSNNYFTIGAPQSLSITSAYGNISDMSIVVNGSNLMSVNKLQYKDTINNYSDELSGTKVKSISPGQVSFYQDIGMGMNTSLYTIKVVDDKGNVSNEIPLDLRPALSNTLNPVPSQSVPTVSTLSPISINQGTNTKLVVNGTNLGGVTSVEFDALRGAGEYSAEFSPISDNQIGVVTPSNLPVNYYYLILRNSAGSSVYNINSPLLNVTSNPSVPSIKLLSPNGGENFTTGNVYNITWYSANLPSGDLTTAWLENSDGGIICTFGPVPTSLNKMQFDLSKPICYRNNTEKTILTSGQYKIWLNSSVSGVAGRSDNYFTISVPVTQPTCTSSTSCVSQYCQYGGNLKKCTTTNSDCSVSSNTTGSCTSAPSHYSTCDSTAQSIVDSVGGCSNIDQSLYGNIYNVCCAPVVVTKETLLSMLNTALADGVIDSQEKTNLLTALNSYLK